MPVIFVLITMLLASFAWAQEKQKGPTCQEQLAQTSVQASNLSRDRSLKEEALAREQVTTYMLRQQIAQLQAELKKNGHPTEPEKPKE